MGGSDTTGGRGGSKFVADRDIQGVATAGRALGADLALLVLYGERGAGLHGGRRDGGEERCEGRGYNAG